MRQRPAALAIVALATVVLACGEARAARFAHAVAGPVLSVIDGANPGVVARVGLGSAATGAVATDPGGVYVYVATAEHIAVVDTRSRTLVATVPVGGAGTLLVHPTGAFLYAGGRLTLPGAAAAERVVVVDTRTRTVIATIAMPASRHVLGMALRPDGSRLYVAHEGGIAVVDTASNAVTAIVAVPARGVVAVDPTGRHVYAAVWGGVAIVDAATDTLVATLAQDLRASELFVDAIAFDPAGAVAYVAGTGVDGAGPEGRLLFVDTGTRTVTASVPVSPARSIAVHPAGGRIYLGGRSNCVVPQECFSSAVTVVDTASRSVVGIVPTPTVQAAPGSAALAMEPTGAALHVFKPGASAVIDTATLGVAALLPGRAGIAFVPDAPPVPGPQIQYTLLAATGAAIWDAWGARGDLAVPADYDGDGRGDLAVLRPREAGAESLWYARRSGDGVVARRQWGATSLGDVAVPADYDGDGRADLAVWRPAEGAWYVLNSANGQITASTLGASGDFPVPADYDGDGRADSATYGAGTWRIAGSKDGVISLALGTAIDVPVPGDYDGDGRANAAVFRPTTGEWLIRDAAAGTVRTVQWGAPGDVPVPGDYDGDGTTDVATWRPATGGWSVLGSKAGAMPVTYWGAPGDVPVAGDYDGDRRADMSVYRP